MAWRFAVLLLLVFAAIAVGWIIYKWEISADDVARGDFVRGLITVLILCGILALVAVVVLTALFAQSNPPTTDESTLKRVSAVREVLAPLFGIFGTIIGFYFGSQTAERARDAGIQQTKEALKGNAEEKANTPPPVTQEGGRSPEEKARADALQKAKTR